MSIPHQIMEGWRFIKIVRNQKTPIEQEWQKTANYSYQEIQDYLKTETNYGVLPPKGKCVIDIDKKSPDFEEAKNAAESLPETFTVKTANGGYHYYYNCPDLDQGLRLQNEAGEIRANGMYVVGPFSELEGGKKYVPEKLVPVATIKKADIEKTFAKWRGETADAKNFGVRETDKTRSGKEFGIVCKMIRNGFTKEQVFKKMELYAKWTTAHPQYREYTYNNALKRVELEDQKGRVGFDNGKFVPKLLGDEILGAIEVKTLKGNGKLYWYNDGVYTEDGEETIKEICANILKEDFSSHRCNETIAYIKAKTFISPDAVNNDWINLENGLLNPLTKEFISHTPEIFSTIRIPIIYDENADCPLWKEKLKEKTDKPTRKVTQEMFGYCYMPKQKFEKAFLLYGPMRTMKSTTLFLLEQMLGDRNVTSYSLQWLTENQFGPAYLYGKPANICADLSTRALRDTGTFMTVTGGDKISSAKKHEHPISFYPSTKLIFSCNNIPPTNNKNLAFYRRWIILEFKKQHSLDESDPDLKTKLGKELPGILNWALEGLERLIEQDRFSYWLSEEEIKDLYERGSNSIQSFIYNKIDTEDDEGVIKKRDVYSSYKKYCEENDLLIENQIKFGRLFIGLTGCGTCKDNKIPAYQGVSFKEGATQQKIGDF